MDPVNVLGHISKESSLAVNQVIRCLLDPGPLKIKPVALLKRDDMNELGRRKRRKTAPFRILCGRRRCLDVRILDRFLLASRSVRKEACQQPVRIVPGRATPRKASKDKGEQKTLP